jgi:hypothetical protein
MVKYGLAVIVLWLIVVFTGTAQAGIYKDDFNRPDEELRASPEWGVAHGAYYGYKIKDNKLVSVYDSPGEGALNADAFVGALYKGEIYQRISIDFKMPDVASGNSGVPHLMLCLNQHNQVVPPWGRLVANDYRIVLRGILDFAVIKYKADNTEEYTSGYISYTKEPLKRNTWYKLILEKKGKVITGTIKTLEDANIGGVEIVDQGTEYKEGRPVILSIYGLPAPSIELDNFEYEKSEPSTEETQNKPEKE